MEKEKNPLNKEELTDDELDAISGGIIVRDEINGKFVYTVYDEQGKQVGLPGQEKMSLEQATVVAQRYHVVAKWIERKFLDYYVKHGTIPPGAYSKK